MIRWTGLAPWEFEFPFTGSLTSTFLVVLLIPQTLNRSSGMREEREERQRLADITAQMAKLYTPEVPRPSLLLLYYSQA